jgi:hypothetical protein
MNRCAYLVCREPIDGWFLHMGGELNVDDYSLSARATADEPLPLCQWHSLLIGGRRVKAPLVSTVNGS